MESVIRAAIIYGALLVMVRMSGRRTLAQLTPFDLVLILVISETTQQALLGDDFSLVNAVVLIVTLFAIDITLSYVKEYSPAIDRLLDGAPILLVAHGEPDRAVMRKTRISLDDVLEAARSKHGLARLEQVRFAILETTGDISIIPEPGA